MPLCRETREGGLAGHPVIQVKVWLCRRHASSASRYGHGNRRRSLHTRNAVHLDVGSRIAVLALGWLGDVLLVLLAATARRHRARCGDLFGGGLLNRLGLWWSGPPVNLPRDTGKGLELEAALGPPATGLAGAVESTQTGVDSTLVRLGAKSVGVHSGRLEGSVFPREAVSINYRNNEVQRRQGLTFAVFSWGQACREPWPLRFHLRPQRFS